MCEKDTNQFPILRVLALLLSFSHKLGCLREIMKDAMLLFSPSGSTLLDRCHPMSESYMNTKVMVVTKVFRLVL